MSESADTAARHPVAPPRPRKWFRRCSALLLLLIPFAVAIGFAWQAPEFYSSRLSRDVYTRDRSDKFFNLGTRFFNSVYNQDRWVGTFDENGLNAWLIHDFQRHLSSVLPSGISEPRVALENGLMRIGFRWGIGPASAVVHVKLATWVPENNRLALELRGAWAGMLPLPTTYVRSLFERLAEAVGFEINWYRHGSRLIGLLEVPVPRVGRYVLLRRAEIKSGEFLISGQNLTSTAAGGRLPSTLKR